MRHHDLGFAASALGLLALGLVWLVALAPMTLLFMAATAWNALGGKGWGRTPVK